MSTISPARLMTSVSPAYGGATWAKALDVLLADPWDRCVIEALAEELRRGGSFQRPVVIDWDDEAQADRVADGMHRTAAAALVGSPIEVSRGYPDEGERDYINVAFQLVLPEHSGPNDAFDAATGLLRSFRLPDGPWVVSDYCSGRPPEFEFIWECPHRRQSDLCRSLEARARSAGGSITIIEAGPETFGDFPRVRR